MYQPRTPGFTKRDPVKRWAVPDRVFFACGSCHILAHAFLERYGRPEHVVTWIKSAGYWGNAAPSWRMRGRARPGCGPDGTRPW